MEFQKIFTKQSEEILQLLGMSIFVLMTILFENSAKKNDEYEYEIADINNYFAIFKVISLCFTIATPSWLNKMLNYGSIDNKNV